MKLTETELRELLANIIYVAELHPEHRMPTLLTGAILNAKLRLEAA